jgi:protein-disulfide isomerase-like protein with CxxC motif
MSDTFSVTWDYRCPFARNVHDHLVTALEAGAPWDVRFLAFSLDQPHVEEGQPSVFDTPDDYPGLLANMAGIVVRDRQPQRFLAAHKALFDARHRHAADLRRREVLAGVLDGVGVDGAAVLADIADGWPLEVHRDEHILAAESWDVFGVPTFVVDGRAAFVRLLGRADGDAERATATISRLVELLGWSELNELKYTTVPV